jgi:undecaprenyl diphosphate synthase
VQQTTTVPAHLGLILDGNRRWAKAQGLPALEGHRRGYENLKTIADAAFERGVKVVSAFVFSTENWNRSKEEVDYLMKLLRWVVTNEVKEMHEKGIRICWLGSTLGMKPNLVKKIHEAETLTAYNQKGTLALCLNHGGHREIAEAVQRIIHEGVKAGDITEEVVGRYIDYPDLPPIDLLVRTSGEQRLSNFMLWRAAYSELLFRPETWPDFTVDSLEECLVEYSKRQRRFGG